jgi:hypothetical protein
MTLPYFNTGAGFGNVLLLHPSMLDTTSTMHPCPRSQTSL